MTLGRSFRLLIGLGLILIIGTNIFLFPSLNGDGFVQSSRGYWPLRIEERDDYQYLVENHPNRKTETMAFYLNLGDYAEGKSVISPPGVLDPFTLQVLSRAKLIIDDTYDAVLDEHAANQISKLSSDTGSFSGGRNYIIVMPPSARSNSYRVMMLDGTVVAVPEPFFVDEATISPDPDA